MKTASGNDKGDPRAVSRAKLAGIIATVLWILGFILPLLIPAGNRFVFLGDFLLLAGFWPILWLWRPGWPWLVFGILNIAIGFWLEVAYVLPESLFLQTPVLGTDPHQVIAVRNHLRDQHSAITWIIIGALSTVYGLYKTARDIFAWFAKRKS